MVHVRVQSKVLCLGGLKSEPLGKQRGKVGRPKTSNRIPTFSCVESQSATPWVRAVGDILESACETSGVDGRVDESKGWFTVRDTSVVHHSQDSTDDR